ncbi:MAG: hypothetical protein JXR96_28260 [Deltaproteobacteria bacterium]|nr:hypothetical protein [Deltaproteobacteria bacterium]
MDISSDRRHCGGCRIECTDGQTCTDGRCTPCEEVCERGEARCISETQYRVCGDPDEDGCLDWMMALTCPGDRICREGRCVLPCTDDCSAGERDCLGNAWRQCGQHDLDLCLDWSQPQPCGDGEVCRDGECRAGRGWFGLAGSEFRPHDQRAGTGSASGGGLSHNFSDSLTPRVAVDPDRRPVVVWADGEGIRAIRWNGVAWEGLGCVGQGREPSLALDGEGMPVVAWRDGDYEIHVHRFDGASWEEFGGEAPGGVSCSEGMSLSPSLALGLDGSPVVAWSEQLKVSPGDFEIYLRRFAGSSWDELDGSASGTGVSDMPGLWSNSPSLAIDASGNPVLAWEEENVIQGYSEIYVRAFDGNSWTMLGDGVTHNRVFSRAPSLVLDAAGSPVVAWSDVEPGHFEIYARRWNGSDWEELAGSGSAGGISDTACDSVGASLHSGADGVLAVAWQERLEQRPHAYKDHDALDNEIYFRRFSGAGWEELAGSGSGGGLSDNRGLSGGSCLALGGDGATFVVWHDASGSVATTYPNEIFLRRFDGAAWQELGDSGAGSVSDDDGSSRYPSLGMDREGRAVLAWQDDSAGETEIFVRYWDGSAWIELGGSASGGGISEDEDHSLSPVAGIDGAGRPVVAWTNEELAYPYHGSILLRRWDGSSWEELGGSGAAGGLTPADGYAGHPCLAFDSSGEPAIAWDDLGDVYLLRYDGASWVELGGSASGLSRDGQASSPSLAIGPDDAPVLAWRHYDPSAEYQHQIYLRRWSGSTWEELGGSASATGLSGDRGPAFAPKVVLEGGFPSVAWEDGTDVLVVRWNGASWEDLGSPTRGGEMSPRNGESRYALAVDSAGMPTVAWEEIGSGQAEICLRRFDGEGWEELDASASGGCVSHSAAGSFNPSMAAGFGMLCLSWSEMGRSSHDIVLRCHEF